MIDFNPFELEGTIYVNCADKQYPFREGTRHTSKAKPRVIALLFILCELIIGNLLRVY